MSLVDRRLLYRVLSGRVEAKRAEDYTEGSGSVLSLVDHMIAAYKARGFMVAVIVGVLGSGKSYYALTSMCQFLQLIGRAPDDYVGCLRAALDNYTVFIATDHDKRVAAKRIAQQSEEKAKKLMGLETLESKVKAVNWRNPWPVLLWDDAGIFGSAYRFYINKFFVNKISALMQVIRRRTRNFIATTPNPDFVLAVLRKIPERLIIVAEPKEGWWSLIKGYRFKLTASGEYVELVFQDRFYRRVPDEFHNYYMELSDLYVDAALALSENILEEAQEVAEGGEKSDIKYLATLLSDRERRVLLYLANRGGFVRAGEIAAVLDLSVNSIWNIMPKLVALGLVKSKRRVGYRITRLGLFVLGAGNNEGGKG